jgi:hypothetical protein
MRRGYEDDPGQQEKTLRRNQTGRLGNGRKRKKLPFKVPERKVESRKSLNILLG